MPAQSPLKATDITEVAAVEQCMRQEAVVAECGVPVAADYGWAPARPRAGNSGPRAPIRRSVDRPISRNRATGSSELSAASGLAAHKRNGG